MTKKLLDRESTNNFPRRAAALNLVVGAILHHDSRDGGSVQELPDIERVVSAIKLIISRNDLEIAPFVSNWDPGLGSLEEPSPGTPSFFDRDIQRALGLRSKVDNRGSSKINGSELARLIEQLVKAYTIKKRLPIFGDLHDSLVSGLVEMLRPVDDSAFDYLVLAII